MCINKRLIDTQQQGSAFSGWSKSLKHLPQIDTGFIERYFGEGVRGRGWGGGEGVEEHTQRR